MVKLKVKPKAKSVSARLKVDKSLKPKKRYSIFDNNRQRFYAYLILYTTLVCGFAFENFFYFKSKHDRREVRAGYFQLYQRDIARDEAIEKAGRFFKSGNKYLSKYRLDKKKNARYLNLAINQFKFGVQHIKPFKEQPMYIEAVKRIEKLNEELEKAKLPEWETY